MKNKIELLFTVLCSLLLIACSKNGNEGAPQNTFRINGVTHAMSRANYVKVDNQNIRLVFSKFADKQEDLLTVNVVITADTITEEHYFFLGNAVNTHSNRIVVASYENFQNNEIKRFSGITNGELSIIQFDALYIVDFNLTIDDKDIEGHYVGKLLPLSID